MSLYLKYEMHPWQAVLTIKNGKNQKKVANPNGEFPIYGSGGVMGYADDFLCKAGTTIIGRKGSINNPIFVNESFWNVDTAFGLEAGEDLDAKFLYYFCLTYNFFKHNKATTLPSLTKADLLKIEMPLPPLKTQQKIAAILDEADKLHRLNKKLIKKYEQLSQSLFLEMFGDPVSNLKGWDSLFLKDGCTKITDGTHDTPQRLKSGIKFITGKHIRPFAIDFDNSDYVTEDVHNTIFKRCNPEFGDILYTNIGVNLGTAAMNHMKFEFSMKNVALIKYNREYFQGRYLEFMLNSPNMKKEIIRIASLGGAQQFLSLNQIRSLRIIIPPIKLQEEFSTRVNEIEKQKAQAQQALLQSEELFNSLLQQAFKGELVKE